MSSLGKEKHGIGQIKEMEYRIQVIISISALRGM
jgi:hypothetical protein